MENVRLALGLWASVVGIGTLVGYSRLPSWQRDEGSRLSAAINFGYSLTTLFAASAPTRPSIPAWWLMSMAPLGITIIMLAQALAVWSGRELGNSLSSGLAPVEGGTLVQTGPYRICRHPIMLSYLMSWTGTMMALGSWLMMIAFGFISLLVMRRVALEEARLLKHFGEAYARYRREVSLIVPFLDPGSESAREIEAAAQRLGRSNFMRRT